MMMMMMTTTEIWLTTLDVWNPINTGISTTISTGESIPDFFLPSTVAGSETLQPSSPGLPRLQHVPPWAVRCWQDWTSPSPNTAAESFRQTFRPRAKGRETKTALVIFRGMATGKSEKNGTSRVFSITKKKNIHYDNIKHKRNVSKSRIWKSKARNFQKKKKSSCCPIRRCQKARKHPSNFQLYIICFNGQAVSLGVATVLYITRLPIFGVKMVKMFSHRRLNPWAHLHG